MIVVIAVVIIRATWSWHPSVVPLIVDVAVVIIRATWSWRPIVVLIVPIAIVVAWSWHPRVVPLIRVTEKTNPKSFGTKYNIRTNIAHFVCLCTTTVASVIHVAIAVAITVVVTWSWRQIVAVVRQSSTHFCLRNVLGQPSATIV